MLIACQQKDIEDAWHQLALSRNLTLKHEQKQVEVALGTFGSKRQQELKTVGGMLLQITLAAKPPNMA